VAVIMLSACREDSSTPASTPIPPAATRRAVGAPPINVAGNNTTGISPSFTLPAGSYTVEWSTTSSDASCAFLLFLATKPDGPSVKETEASIFPTAQKDYGGTSEWTGVPAGSYVIQEDRSGALSCTGSWDATLTPH
jgi:hypothetical protein